MNVMLFKVGEICSFYSLETILVLPWRNPPGTLFGYPTPKRLNQNLNWTMVLWKPYCAASFRSDPSEWRHQLELPVPGRHGQRTVWLSVQRGVFLFPLQQGRGEGLRVHRQLPWHARVHAEVPRALSSGGRQRRLPPSRVWRQRGLRCPDRGLCLISRNWRYPVHFYPVNLIWQRVTHRRPDCQLRSINHHLQAPVLCVQALPSISDSPRGALIGLQARQWGLRLTQLWQLQAVFTKAVRGGLCECRQTAYVQV